MSFYNNSPGMVDDIPMQPSATPTPAPVAKPAVQPVQQDPGEAAARRLYDKSYATNAGPTPAPAPAAQPDPDTAAAEAMFPSMKPAEPPAQDEWSDLANAPHAAEVTPIAPHITNELQRLAEVSGHDAKEAAGIAAGWSRTFQAHGITTDNETADLMAAGMEFNRLGGPPDAETKAAWETEVQTTLAREFGPDNVGHVLQTARRYVAANPALHDYLHSTGLGSHPKVVKVIAATARRALNAGKKF